MKIKINMSLESIHSSPSETQVEQLPDNEKEIILGNMLRELDYFEQHGIKASLALHDKNPYKQGLLNSIGKFHRNNLPFDQVKKLQKTSEKIEIDWEFNGQPIKTVFFKNSPEYKALTWKPPKRSKYLQSALRFTEILAQKIPEIKVENVINNNNPYLESLIAEIKRLDKRNNGKQSPISRIEKLEDSIVIRQTLPGGDTVRIPYMKTSEVHNALTWKPQTPDEAQSDLLDKIKEQKDLENDVAQNLTTPTPTPSPLEEKEIEDLRLTKNDEREIDPEKLWKKTCEKVAGQEHRFRINYKALNNEAEIGLGIVDLLGKTRADKIMNNKLQLVIHKNGRAIPAEVRATTQSDIDRGKAKSNRLNRYRAFSKATGRDINTYTGTEFELLPVTEPKSEPKPEPEPESAPAIAAAPQVRTPETAPERLTKQQKVNRALGQFALPVFRRAIQENGAVYQAINPKHNGKCETVSNRLSTVLGKALKEVGIKRRRVWLRRAPTSKVATAKLRGKRRITEADAAHIPVGASIFMGTGRVYKTKPGTSHRIPVTPPESKDENGRYTGPDRVRHWITKVREEVKPDGTTVSYFRDNWNDGKEGGIRKVNHFLKKRKIVEIYDPFDQFRDGLDVTDDGKLIYNQSINVASR